MKIYENKDIKTNLSKDFKWRIFLNSGPVENKRIRSRDYIITNVFLRPDIMFFKHNIHCQKTYEILI